MIGVWHGSQRTHVSVALCVTFWLKCWQACAFRDFCFPILLPFVQRMWILMTTSTSLFANVLSCREMLLLIDFTMHRFLSVFTTLMCVGSFGGTRLFAGYPCRTKLFAGYDSLRRKLFAAYDLSFRPLLTFVDQLLLDDLGKWLHYASSLLLAALCWMTVITLLPVTGFCGSVEWSSLRGELQKAHWVSRPRWQAKWRRERAHDEWKSWSKYLKSLRGMCYMTRWCTIRSFSLTWTQS